MTSSPWSSDGLKIPLSTAFHRAEKANTDIGMKQIVVQDGENKRRFDLLVRPLPDRKNHLTHFFIPFVPSVAHPQQAKDPGSVIPDNRACLGRRQATHDRARGGTAGCEGEPQHHDRVSCRTGEYIEKEDSTNDGQWFLNRIFPFRRTESGSVDGVVLTFTDITDLKRAEQKANLSNQELERKVGERPGAAAGQGSRG